jgi:hypothetical protein
MVIVVSGLASNRATSRNAAIRPGHEEVSGVLELEYNATLLRTDCQMAAVHSASLRYCAVKLRVQQCYLRANYSFAVCWGHFYAPWINGQPLTLSSRAV